MSGYHAKQASDTLEIIETATGDVCATITTITPELLAKLLDIDVTEAQGMMLDWDGGSAVSAPLFTGAEAIDKLILAIAERAANRYQGLTVIGVAMDVAACHAKCPLDLAGLLATDKGNFSHDVGGIVKHLDRKTGLLRDCFVPRYAAVYQAAPKFKVQFRIMDEWLESTPFTSLVHCRNHIMGSVGSATEDEIHSDITRYRLVSTDDTIVTSDVFVPMFEALEKEGN